MRKNIALLLAIAFVTMLGLSACKFNTSAQAPVEYKPSAVELVKPNLEEVGPPLTITAPDTSVTNQRVQVDTSASPETPAQTTAPQTTAPQATAPAPSPTQVVEQAIAHVQAQVQGHKPSPAQVQPAQPAPAQPASCPPDWYLFSGGECVPPNPPAQPAPVQRDPYTGNSETHESCTAKGMALAEDRTCVNRNYWDSPKSSKGKDKGTKNSYGRSFDTGNNHVR